MSKKDWHDLAKYRVLGTPEEIAAQLEQLEAVKKYIQDHDSEWKKDQEPQVEALGGEGIWKERSMDISGCPAGTKMKIDN